MKWIVLRVFSGITLACALGHLPLYGQSVPQPVQGVAAYDSVGKRIGNVLGFGFPGVVVSLSKDGMTAVLGLSKTRFFGTESSLLWTTSDCTGVPYHFGDLPGHLNSPVPQTAVWNGKVYIAGTSTHTISVKSEIRTHDDTPTCIANEFELPAARAAILLMDIGPLFTPPFIVR